MGWDGWMIFNAQSTMTVISNEENEEEGGGEEEEEEEEDKFDKFMTRLFFFKDKSLSA